MSLVNWNLTPQRVELVTDTLAYDRGLTGLFYTTKFMTVPHARVIFAEMGAGDCIFELQRRMLNCDLPNGIDDVAVRGQNWMKQIHAEFLTQYGDLLDSDRMHDRWNLVIFGWSEKAGRVVGYRFNSPRDFEPEPVPDGDAFNPAPEVDRTDPRMQAIVREHGPAIMKFKSPESFVAVAKFQHIHTWDRLGGGIGGDLLMATLTRDGITTRKIWTFPERAPEPRGSLDIRLQEEPAHAS